MVSVPWVITTPSAPRSPPPAPQRGSGPSRAGVSCELSTAIEVDDVESDAAVEARDEVGSRLGRRATPSASVLVAMVPPVVMTTRRLMRRLFTIATDAMMGE